MADSLLERQYLGRITPGMDVCDVTGEKVGSIAHVYHVDGATDEGTPVRTGDDVIEVKTGFLGFGKHLFIPVDAVQEVLTDSVFLSKSRETFAELGFETRPVHLIEVH